MMSRNVGYELWRLISAVIRRMERLENWLEDESTSFRQISLQESMMRPRISSDLMLVWVARLVTTKRTDLWRLQHGRKTLQFQLQRNQEESLKNVKRQSYFTKVNGGKCQRAWVDFEFWDQCASASAFMSASSRGLIVTFMARHPRSTRYLRNVLIANRTFLVLLPLMAHLPVHFPFTSNTKFPPVSRPHIHYIESLCYSLMIKALTAIQRIGRCILC